MTAAVSRSVLLGLTAALCAGAMLYRFPPQDYGFYPACPFHELTGLLCPGCGGTRAIAALLHGHFAEAWGLNGLVMAALPLLLAYAGLACRQGRWPRVPHSVVALLIASAAMFSVVRNLA